MKAFVTGANGFIGSHVCRTLLRHNISVKAFLKETSSTDNIADLDIEYSYGDIRNYDEVNLAMQSCDIVFHIAALHIHWLTDFNIIYDINVKGTENVCKAAINNKIKRIVHTSTQNVIGTPKKGYATEETVFNKWKSASHYTKSKFLAEKTVLSFINKGLDAVIVNPSGPFGAGDKKIGPTSKILTQYLKQKYPFYFKAWFNAIDVEDVAEGHYLAYKNGKKGERYILANENLSLDNFFDLLQNATNIAKPKVRIPRLLALILAYLCEFTSNYITHKSPLLTVDRIKQRGKPKLLDNSKAITELGLQLTPIEETIKKAIAYYNNLFTDN